MQCPPDAPPPAGSRPATSPRGAADAGRFDAPWALDVGPSRYLGIALGLAHGVAVVAVVVAPMPPTAAAALCVVILLSAVFHLARVGRLSMPTSVLRVEVDGKGGVRVRQRDGRERAGRLLPSTVVSGRLVLLRLRLDGSRRARSVPLLPDNCETDAFRRLRAGLVWQAGPALGRVGPVAD
jgi:hypothetical protein